MHTVHDVIHKHQTYSKVYLCKFLGEIDDLRFRFCFKGVGCPDVNQRVLDPFETNPNRMN